MAGATIIPREDLIKKLATHLNMTSTTPGPFDSWLLIHRIRTPTLRMKHHQDNTRRVAAILEESPLINRMHYIGRDGVLGFIPSESVGVPKTLELIRLFTFTESLGGVEPLIICPAVQTHAGVPRERRMNYGPTDDLLRLSVGLERWRGLIDDLPGTLKVNARQR